MLVSCRDVVKRFDTTVAVRGVTLEIPRGTLLGVVGPNGTGKTTLLRLLATLAKPDTGTIELDGQDVAGDPSRARRRLGYMPAELGRFPDMSVEDYLSYFAAAHGVERRVRRSRVDFALELTDLLVRRDEPVAAGSTGIKQRVLLAKTLVHDPELLLLDEPSAGLDPRARIEVRAVLRELRRLGKTIVLSSHILADLEEICDEVAIFERGAIVARGSVDELRRAHAAPGSRTFLLEVPKDARARALSLAAEEPHVVEAREDETTGRIRLRTTEGRNGNAVLRALCAADVEILRFSEETPRLEDVFLRVTKQGIAPRAAPRGGEASSPSPRGSSPRPRPRPTCGPSSRAAASGPGSRGS